MFLIIVQKANGLNTKKAENIRMKKVGPNYMLSGSKKDTGGFKINGRKRHIMYKQ